MAAVASNVITPSLISRINNKAMLAVVPVKDTLPFFQDGMYLGWSGFTSVGYPKAVPIALADHVEKNNLQGKLRFNLFIGASVGKETEDRWAKLDMIARRAPYQSGKAIQEGINKGKIMFADHHLSLFAQELQFGYFTLNKNNGLKDKLDIAILEATEI